MLTNMQLSDGTVFPISDIESMTDTENLRVIRYTNGLQIYLFLKSVTRNNDSTGSHKLSFPFLDNANIYCIASASNKKSDAKEAKDAAFLNSNVSIGAAATPDTVYWSVTWNNENSYFGSTSSKYTTCGIHIILIGRWK